jgi:hypothetical protein
MGLVASGMLLGIGFAGLMGKLQLGPGSDRGADRL